MLPKLLKRDDDYVTTMVPGKYQGLTKPSELILDPGQGIDTNDSLFLFLQGWIFPTDASINFALSQTGINEGRCRLLYR